jgi:hypothetical protein
VASVLSAVADRSVLSWRTRKEIMGSGSTASELRLPRRQRFAKMSR